MERDTNLPITNDPTGTDVKLERLLDCIEPDIPTDEQRKALALLAEILTMPYIDLLGGLIEDVRGNAEQRGEREFIAKMERALKAREDTDE